jgi:predicted SAM-dependent methyltransferase
MLKRINIGCGSSPTPGWGNYDNSPSIFIAKHPIICFLLKQLKLLSSGNIQLIKVAQNNELQFANAAKRIPLPSESIEAIYTSHMLEHFDRKEAKIFLTEAFRVLRSEGILRVVVPDLKAQVDEYYLSGDADQFLEKSLLPCDRPNSFITRIKFAFIGPRNHLWMYDQVSLVKLVTSMGFLNTNPIPFGTTNIPNPGNLDLYERAEGSICIEAFKP